MMTPKRLCVVHLPSDEESAWRLAISDAAASVGLPVADYSSDGWAKVAEGGDALVHFADATDVGEQVFTDYFIVQTKPSVTERVLVDRYSLSQQDARRATARLYAFAAEMAGRDAIVVDSTDRQMIMPGVGVIERPKVAKVSARSGEDNPLAYFETLPPTVGASATWDPAIFVWHGEAPGVADLTGRRRLLQHGPYLEMSPGLWSIKIDFTLMIDSGTVELRFEWGNGSDCTVDVSILKRSGRYSLSLSRLWTAPSVCELRIWLDRAVFDGRLEITSYSVSMAGEARAEGDHFLAPDQGSA